VDPLSAREEGSLRRVHHVGATPSICPPTRTWWTIPC
jgi:hypothetical protein